MPRKNDSSLAEDLAVHVARGGRVARWAKEKEIGERAAYRLYSKPGVQKRISEIRRDMTEAAVGIGAQFLDASMAVFAAQIRDAGTSETIKAAAANSLIANLVKLKAAGETEARLASLEAEVRQLKGEQP